MRDDGELMTLELEPLQRPSPLAAGDNVIPFPKRPHARPAADTDDQVGPAEMAAVLDVMATALPQSATSHAPTLLAALGATVGFAAQQSLLLAGGLAWAQPARNGHLDRLLLAEDGGRTCLWPALRNAAHAAGAQHLPDPKTLLAATLRCVGTSQLGRITLPLEYRLLEQPQPLLVLAWPAIRAYFDAQALPATRWPHVLSAATARSVGLQSRRLPPHVALRVVVQAALAMALIEPRSIPGAALKPSGN